jgi:(2Fe-2S) ferredoxin
LPLEDTLLDDDAPYLAPYGRHVFICTGEYSDSCDPDRTAMRLSARLGQKLGDLGDYLNPQRVKVSTAPCLGVCMRGPILVVYPDGVWYHHLDEELLDRIVEEHLRQGRPVLERAFYVPDGEYPGEP